MKQKTLFTLYRFDTQQDYVKEKNRQREKHFTTIKEAVKYARKEIKRYRSNGVFKGFKLTDKHGEVKHSFPTWRF